MNNTPTKPDSGNNNRRGLGMAPASTSESSSNDGNGTVATSSTNNSANSWFELEISGTIRNISPQLFNLSHLTSLYLNDNQLSRVPPDISRLQALTHLDLSQNKLRSLPAELGDMVRLKDLLLNNNLLRVLPYEIGKLFKLQQLGLQGNPLAPEIQSIYNECNGTQRLLTYMIDNLASQAHYVNYTSSQPPQRHWIPITTPDRTRPVAIYTVMCYNVLCDKYATRQLYGYCPSWALNWDYRKKGIIEEIRHYSADIICLQEVETDQFNNFFLPELKRDGYSGIFSPKSRARTMTESERKYVDGCAIFFRTSKFSLKKEQLIEFNKLAMDNAEGCDDMLNRVMTKDNIGLAALLETKETIWEKNGTPSGEGGGVGGGGRQSILVATCHIHWDPEFCDVKLIQTMMLMGELKNIIDEASTSLRPGSARLPSSESIPLILCGDLNSLPNSGVVEYLTTGCVPCSHEDFRELTYKKSLSHLGTGEKKDHYTHPFKLGQAYGNEILPFTNYTYDFKGVIDYILYSQSVMRPLGVLGPLNHDWFVQNKVLGCPHPHIPSDHVPLLVEFEMLPVSSNTTASGSTSIPGSRDRHGGGGAGTAPLGGGVASQSGGARR